MNWLILGAAVMAAVMLDILLIWGWRYWRGRAVPGDVTSQAGGEPAPPGWFAAGLEQLLSWLTGFAGSGRRLFRLTTELLGELRASELDLLRTFVVLGALLVSASLGYIYADSIMVRGWQLWLWLLCIGTALAALMSWSRPPLRLGREHLPLAGLVLIAALLRLTWLDRIPPGLHVDEAGAADFALRHIYASQLFTLSPFRTALNSMPSLYYYLPWLSMEIVGRDFVGLRLPSALAGSVAVLATYLLVREVHNRRTAWMAAGLMAAYHYHIHWSRIGLNNIWDTLWVPTVLALMAWGWRTKWSGGSVLAGLALGLAQYFYPGNKIAFPLLAFLAYQLASRDGGAKRMLRQLAKLLALAGVVAAPLFMFFVAHPELMLGRLLEVLLWQPGYEAFPEASDGLLATVWSQMVRALASFTTLTDVTGFYGPGVPLVLGLAAPLFVAGILWAWHERQLLPLIWLGMTAFFGGFLITGTPSSSHYAVVIPAISWLIATPLSAIFGLGKRRLALALLVALLVTDLGFYFGVYIPGGAHPHLEHTFPEGPFG